MTAKPVTAAPATAAAPLSWPQRLRLKLELCGTPAVLGLDPNPEQIPQEYGPSDGSAEAESRRMLNWCTDMLERTHGLFPAVKLQAAWFELHGAAGMRAMEAAMALARQAGALVIADVKRGDIGHSAAAYAQGWVGRNADGQPRADAMTAIPWLGDESIAPFRRVCRQAGTGALLCARTSNPGSELFQEMRPAGDSSDATAAWMAVADLAAKGADPGKGADPHTNPLGLVVGGNHPDRALAIRKKHRGLVLLVPGFGAQGADMSRAGDFQEDGANALFPSSRAITFGQSGTVRDRARAYIDELNKHCGQHTRCR